MPKKVNIKDEEFGSLTVSHRTDRKCGTSYVWECDCKCGGKAYATSASLKSGNTTGCKRCARGRNIDALWKGHGDISGAYWASLKYGAAERDLVFELTIEEAWQKYQEQCGQCALTGLPILFGRNMRRDWKKQTASLDRIDSTKPYQLSNIQWVHKDINRMKLNYDTQVFVEYCRLVAERAKKLEEGRAVSEGPRNVTEGDKK